MLSSTVAFPKSPKVLVSCVSQVLELYSAAKDPQTGNDPQIGP